MLSIPREDGRSYFYLLCTRASTQNPIYTEEVDNCLVSLAEKSYSVNNMRLHFPIIDPERGTMNLRVLYDQLDKIYRNTGVQVVLHDRVYVTIGCYSIRKESFGDWAWQQKIKED